MSAPDPVDRPYDAARHAADALAAATGVDRHDLLVVLGSGWRDAVLLLGETEAEVPLEALGGFPVPTVEGHGASARSVAIGERRALVLTGRAHLYEGHHPNAVVHAVRTAALAGCSTAVFTNAAGGVRPGLQPGQPVLLADQLNLTGRTPLEGVNDPRLGPRFPDMTDAYDTDLRARIHAELPGMVEGVYAGFLGPAYETPAEVAMARTLGADLVGMSTVLEVIAARHVGLRCVGLSLVTNAAAGLGEERLDHDDVLTVAADAAPLAASLLGRIVDLLP